MTRRLLLTLLCVLAPSACHTFRPVATDQLTAGQAVRVRITGAYSDSLSAILLSDQRIFEGVVIENSGPSVLMEIPVQAAFEGMRFQTLSQRINVPKVAFVDLEMKEFSRSRSLAALAIGGAALGAIVVSQLNKTSGGDARPGSGGPNDAIVSLPLISLPVSAIPWIWRR